MDININFKPLNEADFSLLQKWLNSSHVKKWWQHDGNVVEKYITYAQGYKLENGEKKLISAFIIYIDDEPIGYIQLYNAYDFIKQLIDLPKSLGMIDFYIGDEKYLGQGLGVKILKAFSYKDFDYVLVDSDINNIVAIKTYEKAGFKKIKELNGEIWMIKENIKVVSFKNSKHYKWNKVCDAWWLKAKGKFTVIEENMPPKASENKHLHQNTEQFFYCLQGELCIEIDGQEYIISSGEGIEVKAGNAHRAFNKSNKNVRFLVVSCPNSHKDRVDV